MAWIKDVCDDVLCGGGLGIIKGIFKISLFTQAETEEIHNLKKLTLSVMEKSPELVSPNVVTEELICEGLRQGKKSALEHFAKNASPQAISAGVVTAAELVCSKSFKQRFADVLMGACLNLAGC